jgi:HSP20 family protein
MSDHWWRRRKRKVNWFNEIYDELEKLGDLINATLEKVYKNSYRNTLSNKNKIKGFSIRIDPNGKPRIKEIIASLSSIDDELDIVDDFEPLVDLIEEKDTLIILATIPGIKKSDIDLRLTKTCLIISVESEVFEWYDELMLPAKVDSKSAKASFKNGVLEVRLKKLVTLTKYN